MSKRRVLGSVDDAIAFFAAYSVMFYCFLLIMSMFLANPRIFCIFIFIYNTILHFFCISYHDIVYFSWKDLFAIYMHMLHICSTWKTRDGRKFVKHFGVLGVSELNLECPSRFSHGIAHDNVHVD